MKIRETHNKKAEDFQGYQKKVKSIQDEYYEEITFELGAEDIGETKKSKKKRNRKKKKKDADDKDVSNEISMEKSMETSMEKPIKELSKPDSEEFTAIRKSSKSEPI